MGAGRPTRLVYVLPFARGKPSGLVLSPNPNSVADAGIWVEISKYWSFNTMELNECTPPALPALGVELKSNVCQQTPSELNMQKKKRIDTTPEHE